MKTILAILAVALMVAFTPVFAHNPAETNDKLGFHSTDEAVAMQVERGGGQVMLHLMVKDFGTYDHIIIERSAESPNYFGKCKYISCTEAKAENGYMLQVDKYPYPASKDVYYRIKTVTKDGIERSYPAVMLASVARQ